MVKDTYRRPTRERSSYAALTSTSPRSFTSYRPEKPLNRSYGHENQILKTTYPKGWKPNPSDKRSRIRRTERSWTGANLVKKLGVVSVALIAGSALFMTPNITGNVIWGLALGKTNMLGAVFFIWGLAGLLFSLRQK